MNELAPVISRGVLRLPSHRLQPRPRPAVGDWESFEHLPRNATQRIRRKITFTLPPARVLLLRVNRDERSAGRAAKAYWWVPATAGWWVSVIILINIFLFSRIFLSAFLLRLSHHSPFLDFYCELADASVELQAVVLARQKLESQQQENKGVQQVFFHCFRAFSSFSHIYCLSIRYRPFRFSL